MGRSLSLPASIRDHDFARLSKTESNPQKRIRLLGLEHVKEGKTCTEVASMLKVSIKAVTTWVKRYAEHGLLGLVDREGRGRKPKLAKSLQANLARKIDGARGELNGGRLLGSDIQKIMLNEFNIQCSLSTVYDTLNRMDYVWISARSKHPNSDPIAQEEFKKNFAEGR